MTLPGLHTIVALEEIVGSPATPLPQNTMAVVALVTSLALIAVLVLSAAVYKKFFKYRMPRGEFRR